MWDTWDTIFTATATDNLFRYTNTLFRYTNTLFWRINSLFRKLTAQRWRLLSFSSSCTLALAPASWTATFRARSLYKWRSSTSSSATRTILARCAPGDASRGELRKGPRAEDPCWVLLLSLLARSPVLFASILALVVSLGSWAVTKAAPSCASGQCAWRAPCQCRRWRAAARPRGSLHPLMPRASRRSSQQP